MSEVSLQGSAAIQTYPQWTPKSQLFMECDSEIWGRGGQNAKLFRSGSQHFWWSVALVLPPKITPFGGPHLRGYSINVWLGRPGRLPLLPLLPPPWCKVDELGLRVEGSGFRVRGLGFRV